MTDAYRLPCRKVIHAVGPIYNLKPHEEAVSLLASCYRTSLELAANANLTSIAFPSISTGVYNFPSSDAAKTASEVVRTFLESEQGQKISKVVFCCFLEKDEVAYRKWLP